MNSKVYLICFSVQNFAVGGDGGNCLKHFVKMGCCKYTDRKLTVETEKSYKYYG